MLDDVQSVHRQTPNFEFAEARFLITRRPTASRPIASAPIATAPNAAAPTASTNKLAAGGFGFPFDFPRHWRPPARRRLFVPLYGNEGADVFYFLGGQGHVGHFRMRLKQERGEFFNIEIRSVRDRCK